MLSSARWSSRCVRAPEPPRRLRIFTPAIELPRAGHPVVGTWHVLALRGVVLPPASGAGTVTVQQELGVGILPVAIGFASGAPVKVVMTQPPPRVGERPDLAGAAARALGLAPDEIETSQLPLVVAPAPYARYASPADPSR